MAPAEDFNFDHNVNANPAAGNNRLIAPGFDLGANICGGSQEIWRDHMMPNSLVTFNRLWLTYQNTAGLPDQPGIISTYYSGWLPLNADPCVPGVKP